MSEAWESPRGKVSARQSVASQLLLVRVSHAIERPFSSASSDDEGLVESISKSRSSLMYRWLTEEEVVQWGGNALGLLESSYRDGTGHEMPADKKPLVIYTELQALALRLWAGELGPPEVANEAALDPEATVAQLQRGLEQAGLMLELTRLTESRRASEAAGAPEELDADAYLAAMPGVTAAEHEQISKN